MNNSGFGNGSVENNDGCLTSVPVDDGPPPLSPISASPAIGLNGTVYVGSEGGTLIAVDPSLNLRWKTTQCDTKGTPTASACSGTLGPFISSPAVYSNSRSGLTTVIAASEAGSVWLFDDTGTTAICTGCFRPTALDDAISGASFVSSPTFMTHPVTLDITGIFIGATVTHSGSTDPSGEIYALNSDGTLKWEYPRRGDPPIGTVTSSLAIGVGNILLFTTDDGNLYALTANGDRKWTFPIGTGSTTGLRLFDPSPLTASLVYATAAGQIIALTPDGGLSWRSPPTPGDDFAASLAIGNQPEITATPLPPSVPTPTPSSGTTPTITPTPLMPSSTLFGITESGTLVVVDALKGTLVEPSGVLPTPIAGNVLSSPALSADLFLVLGTANGMLYSVNSRTGLAPNPTPPPLPTPPCGWPVQLPTPATIRSSPSIGTDGTIYVGAGDGRLYAVGRR